MRVSGAFYLVILCLITCSFICSGQDNSIKFRRLTIDDGLSQSSVNSIVQDKEGYIWLATASGLNRYDGYEFRVFKKEIDNDSSLSNNRVAKLFIDSKNQLWVGTEGGGLSLFNAQSNSFIQIPLTPGESLGIKAIYESRDGVLWIGARNGGFFKVEHIDNSFAVTPLPVIVDQMLVEDDINDITSYMNKLMLGTSGSGIIYFDPASGQFFSYDHPLYGDVLRHCFVNSFYPDSQRNLWIATEDVGIFVFHDNLERATKVDFESFGMQGLLCNNIYAFREDRLGFLWVGTKNGLNVSEKRIRDYESFGSLSFTSHIFSASDQKSLSNNFVLSIEEDQSGLLWIGTSAGGVNIFNRGSELFNYFQKVEGLSNSLENEVIMSVYDDERGALWIGSDAGLIKFDKQKKTFENRWNEVPDNIFNSSVLSITELEPGVLLLGTYDRGLVIFDQHKGQYSPLDNDDYLALNPNLRLLTTYKDRHGDVWVGTDGDGILRFRYDRNIQGIEFAQYKAIPGDTSGLSHNDIWKFFEDVQGVFWIGTAGGLNLYHPDEEKFTQYKHIPNDKESLSSDRVYCINNLDSTRLLIGTDNGLNIFDKTTGKVEYFIEKDGLPDHVIYGILDENNNHYWLSTNNGISRFDYRNKTFTNYSVTDGLPSNEFNAGAYFRNSKGELFFGGTKGLLWFNPSGLHTLTNQFIPPVVISGVEVNGPGAILNFGATEPLILKNDQNTITVSFAALDFTSPSKNQYTYKMDQFGQDWTFLGNRRFVTFSDLRPGNYDFSVKGSNNDGIWNETPVTLRFTILPPWWQTWWAYSLYFSLILGMVLFLRRYEMKRFKLRQRAAHLADLDAFRSRFYTNITHEFRTPLTVIMGMSQSLQANIREKRLDDVDRSLGMIQRNGENLLHLINQMLDLAKVESGNLELQQVQTDVIPFVKYVCESFQSLANERQINLTVYSETDELVLDFDPDKLSVVISNLLTNAIKFTQRNGKIVVHLNRFTENGDEFFVVKVRDSGMGISENELPNIFDRFYQAGALLSHRGEGTGIGLALTKELVELMEGSIEVKSKPGKGSEFTVRIPAYRKAPKTLERYPTKHSATLTPAILPGYSPEQFPGNDSDGDLPLALIIEDNPDVAHYLKTCLHGKYQTLHAGEGTGGIEQAIEKVPDIIICDVMMAGKDGFEVCSTLKSDGRTDHIPIIMLTARATTEDRLTGLSLGADAYLTKPFEKAELFTRLDQLVLLRKKLRQKFEKDGFANISFKRTKSPEAKFLQNAISIICEDISNDLLTARHLSHRLHLSESQLYRKLKAITGKSTAIFIRSIRLQKARQMILTTDKTISEIAYEVGFNDPSWFSRAFKEEFGYSPNETRK